MNRPLLAVARRPQLLLAFLTWGYLISCQSMTLSPDSENLPTVEVAGAYPSEIATACDEVLENEGYRLVSIDGNSRLYEKDGSWLQEAAYGTWTSKGMAERLHVQIRSLGSDGHIIECEPLLVSYAGTQLEESRRFPKWKRGKYEQMLNQVKGRLAYVN